MTDFQTLFLNLLHEPPQGSVNETVSTSTQLRAGYTTKLKQRTRRKN